MTLSRKEFFRQGFVSLGRAAFDLAGVLRDGPAGVGAATAADAAPLESGPGVVAVPQGGECLAQSCGCFSCTERCEAQAITIVPGRGIAVDTALCTGCGACADVCPTTPKSIGLAERKA